MNKRIDTKTVHLGDIHLGGCERVLVQSMCSVKTSHIDEIVAEINECAFYGASIMRVSVLDEEDVKALPAILKKISVPLVADIHFDYKLALGAMEAGVTAIRINPGNIGSEEGVKAVVECAKKHHVVIRVGVNSGSMDQSIYEGKDVVAGEYLVESAKKHVAMLEKYGFDDIVISLKGSDVRETIAAYRLAAEIFPYPLHLGITEAGPKDVSLLRSAAGLAPLLLEGIGDTIRISLTEDPAEEVKAANRLLHDLGLKPDYPTFISCPTCGRTQVSLMETAKTIQNYLEEHKINKVVAVMGCVVNGPGEARHADLGCAGGNGQWVLFHHGESFRTVKDDEIIAAMIEEINKL